MRCFASVLGPHLQAFLVKLSGVWGAVGVERGEKKKDRNAETGPKSRRTSLEVKGRPGGLRAIRKREKLQRHVSMRRTSGRLHHLQWARWPGDANTVSCESVLALRAARYASVTWGSK